MFGTDFLEECEITKPFLLNHKIASNIPQSPRHKRITSLESDHNRCQYERRTNKQAGPHLRLY